MQSDDNGHKDRSEQHFEGRVGLVERVTEVDCNAIDSERSTEELVTSVGCNKPVKDS